MKLHEILVEAVKSGDPSACRLVAELLAEVRICSITTAQANTIKTIMNDGAMKRAL